ncbi:MAG: dioxygenase, partial [Nesterenkonia sp.]|nr:dioxygenase [Nesterenkonia sp.]
MTTPTDASAAESGAGATDAFRRSGKLHEGADIPPERVSLLAGELIRAANDIAEKHEVTYEEYNILKSWLIQVGEDG